MIVNHAGINKKLYDVIVRKGEFDDIPMLGVLSAKVAEQLHKHSWTKSFVNLALGFYLTPKNVQ